MKDTFKAYLAQQKADNKYMTAPSKELLGEGIFDNRKYDCYSVSIDFTSEYMVKTLTNMLINDYKTDNADASTASSVKSLIGLGSKEFSEKLREKLFDMVAETVKATKQLRTFFGLGKDSSALAAIQTEGENGTTLKYIFFRASKKTPKAYAERFRDEVGRNPKISMLKKGMDIEEETYYKSDIKKARENNIFIKLNKDEIIKGSFMTGIVSKIQEKVKVELKDADDKVERGNLISVYSVPFKVDDALIKETAQNTKDVEEFYTKLVEKINAELASALKQVRKLDDYVGFIPTKSYGFNLYFKDKDTATDFAEKINQEGEGKVNERKRYEKKISKLFQLLDKDVDLSSLSTPTNNATDFFRGTLFARTHVAELIKEKFPSAEDQLTIYQYIIKYDNEELKNFLYKFKLDVDESEIHGGVNKKLHEVLENLQGAYKDELVSIQSEGSNLIFFFRKTAMIDAVKSKIASAMSCEMRQIKVTKTAMTAKEVKTFKDKISELDDLVSFYKAIDKLYGETVKLIKGWFELDEETIKAEVDDNYQDQVLNLLIGITKVAQKVDGFGGLIVDKEDGVVNIYFKDKESFTHGKELIMQKYGKMIKSFLDKPETVEIRRTEAAKLHDAVQPDNLKAYFERLFNDKKEAENTKLATNLIIKFDYEKFYNLPISDILSDGAFNLLKTELKESFQYSFKTNLLKSINLLTEAKSIFTDSEFLNRVNKWWESNGKKGTLKDYIENAEDKIRTKEITLAGGLLASFWEHFAIYLKNILIQKAGNEQADNEFNYKVTDDALVMHATERVGKFLTGVLKNPKSFANVINKTIKGSDNVALEFTKPEGIK